MIQALPGNDFEIIIRTGILRKRPRRVYVNSEYIEYGPVDASLDQKQRIYWKDFEAMRYGYNMIRGYMFYIGTYYKLLIRNRDGRQICISLSSLYAIGRTANYEQLRQILDAVYRLFLNDYFGNLVQSIQSGASIKLAGVDVSNSGVSYAIGALRMDINWIGVELPVYKTCFYIKPAVNPEKALRVSYLEDWNGVLLYSVLQTILKNQ